MLPPLHVVTDDAVLADPEFEQQARDVLEAGGGGIALHVRGHATPAVRLYLLTTALRPLARSAGALLFVNDRVDIALACDADGLQLNRGSLPLPDARTLFAATGIIGYSAHSVEEAATAVAAGAGFVVLGSIWATRSHPDAKPAGTAMLNEAARSIGAPVIAIGGISPERVAEAAAAGAHGVAVLSGVWGAPKPAATVAAYLEALVPGRSSNGDTDDDSGHHQR